LQPPSNLATPTAAPSKVVSTQPPQPAATTTATPEPGLTPTSSPSPQPTATYPPYAGTPFTITFIRDGNLWLSDIGGTGERQLTREGDDWPVVEYATAPSCDKIAYIPYQGPPNANALIKEVNLSNGTVMALAGENDPYIEYGIGWLDKDHMTFAVSEFAAPGYAKDPAIWAEIQPFHHIVLDLVTGERTFVPESLHFSQSPNGRYWLTGSCGYVYECPLQYVLHDLVTRQHWRVAESIGWGRFLGWSPDSQWMLFNTLERGEARTPAQLVLINVATQQEQQITPSDKDVRGAAWSPDGQSIALTQCDVGICGLWTMDKYGKNLQRVPKEITDAAWIVDWIPDRSRLIFTREEDSSIVWSVGTDSTDLRPIVANADSPQVLCGP
jgi:WD40 repeat protein